MSRIDPEVLYLILTKVAGSQSYYNHDPAQLAPGQKPGTITFGRLSEVYGRVTGHPPGNRTAWTRPLTELNALLGSCRLPPLGAVVVTDALAPPDGDERPWLENLEKVRVTRWPPFRDLRNLYGKGR